MRPFQTLYLPLSDAAYPRFQTVHHNDGRVFERSLHSDIHSVYRIDRDIVPRKVFYAELYGPEDDIT